MILVTETGVEGASMSPLFLFLQADIVVKIVMIGLVLASVLTWAIIFAHATRMRKLWRENDRFERDFRKADNLDRFAEARGKEALPSPMIVAAGITEWRRSTDVTPIDKDGTRARLATAVHSAA